nr:CF0 subunit I of ATP synthase [Streptofilum sp. BC4-VF8pt]WKT08745.1 CF0 subunit I of ATP synthase [Streptofilum sp. ZNP2-VF4pt]
MKNLIDTFAILTSFPMEKSFSLNGNILETNLINLGVVLGFLVYFGSGLLSSLLENRKKNIEQSLSDAEERYKGANEQLKQAQNRFLEAKKKADEIRQNGLLQIQRERQELIQAADNDAKRLEESKNATLRFEEQRAIDEVRRQVSSLALEKALQKLRVRLNADVHARVIDHSIGLLKNLGSVTD